MLDLFKLFIRKPLEAIVAATAMGVVLLAVSVTQVKTAQAVQDEIQSTNNFINSLVLEQQDLLSRIDANVGFLKESQEENQERFNRIDSQQDMLVRELLKK